MDVLVLGRSRFLEKRGLLALRQAGFSRIDIASHSRRDAGVWTDGDVYGDYADALARSNAPLVYISLINVLHVDWARRALDAGRHVVVDKPLAMTLGDTRDLLSLAAARDVCLAEATVFADHPAMQAFCQKLSDIGGAKRLTVVLSVPPYPRGDFRHDVALGGGALNDIGPYAAATGRMVFGAPPDEVLCRATYNEGLVTAFSLLARYGADGFYTGHFGFDTEYRNDIDVLGPGGRLSLERIFTLPADLDAEIGVRIDNKNLVLSVPAADAAAHFFKRLKTAIAAGVWGEFIEPIEIDAKFRAALAKGADSAPNPNP